MRNLCPRPVHQVQFQPRTGFKLLKTAPLSNLFLTAVARHGSQKGFSNWRASSSRRIQTRKGRETKSVSSPKTSADEAVEEMFANISRKHADMSCKEPEKTSISSSSSISPRSSPDFLIMPGGYEHSWSHMDARLCIHNHNIVCDDNVHFHEQDTSLILSQLHLDEF